MNQKPGYNSPYSSSFKRNDQENFFSPPATDIHKIELKSTVKRPRSGSTGSAPNNLAGGSYGGFLPPSGNKNGSIKKQRYRIRKSDDVPSPQQQQQLHQSPILSSNNFQGSAMFQSSENNNRPCNLLDDLNKAAGSNNKIVAPKCEPMNPFSRNPPMIPPTDLLSSLSVQAEDNSLSNNSSTKDAASPLFERRQATSAHCYNAGDDTQIQDEMYPMVLMLNRTFTASLSPLQLTNIRKMGLDEIPVTAGGSPVVLQREVFRTALGSDMVQGMNLNMLSRNHCSIQVCDDGKAVLTNLSTNGISHNNAVMTSNQKIVLENGDTFCLMPLFDAMFEYRFQVNPGSEELLRQQQQHDAHNDSILTTTAGAVPLPKVQRTIGICFTDPIESGDEFVLHPLKEYEAICNGLLSSSTSDKSGVGQRIELCSRFVNPLVLQEMTSKAYRVIHFSVKVASKDGLTLEDGTGGQTFVNADQFSRLFDNSPGLQLAVVVYHGNSSGIDTFSSIKAIQNLVSINYSSHEEEGGDEAALNFIKLFYGALGAGESIESCFNKAKESLKMHEMHFSQKFLLRKSTCSMVPFHRISQENQGRRKYPSLRWEGWNALPPYPSPFMERRRELSALCSELMSNSSSEKVIVISGEAGIGKTSVALASAHYVSLRKPIQKRILVFDINLLVEDEDNEDCILHTIRETLMHRLSAFTSSEDEEDLKNPAAVLMVLDNIDPLISENVEFGRIINDLCMKQRYLKILVTVEDVRSSVFHQWTTSSFIRTIHLGPLSTEASSKLLNMSVNRVITKSELKRVPDAAIMTTEGAIKHHPAFLSVTGNPAKVLGLAAAMAQTPLDNL